MEIHLKIQELKSLIQKKREVADEIQKLKTSALTDFSYIKTMYSIYIDLINQKGYGKSNVYHRNKFIFSVLYFYSPITLVGGPTEKGVRNEIAKIIGVAPTTISDNISEIGFLYAYYDDFREDVEFLCSEISQIINTQNNNQS